MRVKGITGASKATGVTCPITVEGRPSLETLDFLMGYNDGHDAILGMEWFDSTGAVLDPKNRREIFGPKERPKNFS